MSDRLFNSIFEMKLRVLLLMSTTRTKAFSINRIVALDFISCYSSDFGLKYENLHGNNSLKFGELPNRRLLTQNAIKELVVQGLINVIIDDGYLFAISEKGRRFINKLKDTYAIQYKAIAKEVVSKYRRINDSDIMALLHGYEKSL